MSSSPVPLAVPPRCDVPVGAGRSNWFVWWILAGAVGAGVLFLCDPAQYGFYPFCLFHRTTGLLCPGCGATRALHQLLHGHWLEAFRMNALLVTALPFIGVWAIRHGLRKYRGEPISVRFRPVWFWSALAVAMLFGVLRNLPFARL